MEVFEFLTVLTLFIGVPWIVFYNVRRIKEARYKAQSGTGEGLRMSELQALIEVAVEDAIEPLQRRIEELEQASEIGLLDAASPALDLDLDAEDPEAVPARRTRARA
ncbi:MAG: hypothetical protein HKN04_04660 [Rhodothermaceae bacterium]|nr:hypothetical protein [Rhodothermaceae bacterium]